MPPFARGRGRGRDTESVQKAQGRKSQILAFYCPRQGVATQHRRSAARRDWSGRGGEPGSLGPPRMAAAEEKVSYIRDVWHDNLESEMATIREMIVSYPCVSMDTEFPGVVVKPIGSFKSGSDYLYQTLRTNVDLLKIIQVRTPRPKAHG
jgi:hypothetical protein